MAHGQDHKHDADSGGAKVNPIQIQKYLKGLDYPTDKQHLRDHAGRKGADERVRKVLERLPDEEFQTPADVSQAVGKIEWGETAAGQVRRRIGRARIPPSSAGFHHGWGRSAGSSGEGRRRTGGP
jgi:hypothetical protein